MPTGPAVIRPRRRGRIRLEAQDTALSRRRSPVRIRYAVPIPTTSSGHRPLGSPSPGCRLDGISRGGARRGPRAPAGAVGRPVEAELAEDLTHVRLDRLWADHQPRGNRLVAVAFGHQLEDFSLARGQLGERVLIPAAPDEPLARSSGRGRFRHRRPCEGHRRAPPRPTPDPSTGSRPCPGGPRAGASRIATRGTATGLGLRSRDAPPGFPGPPRVPRRCASAAS